MKLFNHYILRGTINKEHITTIIKLCLGVMALFASSQIIIPLKPVPITLQTVVVSLIAFTYSPRLSCVTVLIYILAGIFGVPMFAKLSSGPSYFFGPTCGYLVGFLIAAPVMSILSVRLSKRFGSIVLCCLIGHFIIYFLGVSWLATIIGLKAAIYSGLLVYIPTGLLKIVIFSYVFSYLNNKYNPGMK